MNYEIDELPQKCKLNKTAIDLTNQKFYNLTFLYPCRVNNRLKWVCKCDCGNYIIVFSSNVKKGNTKSCGCIKKEQPSARKDLTGQKFGKLLVIGEPESRNDRGTYWKCQCACGNIVYKCSADLVNSRTSSCGCLKSELHSTMNDLTNQTFGNLTALYTDKVGKGGQRIWHCRCDCGKEIDVLAGNLRRGNTTSCGCKKSKNNELIEKYLQNKNINYKREYSFKDLFYKEKGILKFDFALFEKDNLIGLIEYQGIQHFQPIDFFGGEKGYKEQIIRDKMKVEYCNKNNYKLFFITYQENTEKRLEEILNELYGE